jgi:hypothetical protein
MRTDNNATSDEPSPTAPDDPGLGARMVSHDVAQAPVGSGGAVDQKQPSGGYCRHQEMRSTFAVVIVQ